MTGCLIAGCLAPRPSCNCSGCNSARELMEIGNYFAVHTDDPMDRLARKIAEMVAKELAAHQANLQMQAAEMRNRLAEADGKTKNA